MTHAMTSRVARLRLIRKLDEARIIATRLGLDGVDGVISKEIRYLNDPAIITRIEAPDQIEQPITVSE